MKNGKYVLIVCLCLLATGMMTTLPEASAQGDADMEIRFPLGRPMYHEGLQSMVLGMYQEVWVNASGTNATLQMYYPGGPASDAGRYVFTRNSSGWFDSLYGRHLKASKCNITTDNITFYVALNTSAVEGIWNMVLDIDGNEVLNTTFYIVSPADENPFGVSRGGVRYRAEPYSFTEKQLLSQDGSFLLRNSGSFPFYVTADFGAMSNVFQATNVSKLMYPMAPGENGEEMHILMDPAGWSPRNIDIDCFVKAVPPEVLDDPSTVALGTEYEFVVSVSVEVRLEDYSLFDMGSIVLQYLPGPITLNYMQERNVSIYLTGTDDIALNLRPHNVTVTRVEWGGTVYNSTIPVSLTEEYPAVINITVRGDFSQAEGWLTYNMTNLAGTVSGERSTLFQTGLAPPTEAPPAERNLMALVVIGIGALLFLGILVAYIVERRKNLEKM